MFQCAAMAAQHILSVDDARLLREILGFVETDQKGLSEEAGVSRAWLSGVLNTEKPKSVDVAMMERLAAALSAHVKSRSTNSAREEEHARDYVTYLSRFGTSTRDAGRTYPAGGPLPVDANHYIERRADEEVFAALDRSPFTPFTTMVRGPVQSGKSSLLARLEHKAQRVGIETARFDPRLSVLAGTSTEASSTSSEATIALAEQLRIEWTLEPPQDNLDTIQKLLLWLIRSLAPTAKKQRLLILDDIASLGAQSARAWLGFVRALHNERSVSGTQVSVAVGITHHLTPFFSQRDVLSSSSIVHWCPKIDLEWFDSDQVLRLENKITGSRAKKTELYDLFRGQPYLSHAAILDRQFPEAVGRWIVEKSETDARTIRKAEPFRRHSRSLLRSIFTQASENDNQALEVLEALKRSCEGKDEIEADIELFMKNARLLNNDQEPAIELYCLIEKPKGI